MPCKSLYLVKFHAEGLWLYYKMNYFSGIFKDFTYYLEALIISNTTQWILLFK